MCCFTGEVKFVADTNIFARDSQGAGQYVVYSMRFSADDELAMVLPVPVAKKTGERDVRFINLEKYPHFFADLDKGFPAIPTAAPADSRGDVPPPPAPLEVIEVGSFEASFVPTIADFARLDARFRLPAQVWQDLPQYQDHGFAVFKLKSGEHNVHPMAFEFPRENPDKLFFPTVHIHDGKVHEQAQFDHQLYCQLSAEAILYDESWEESPQPAAKFMDHKLAGKLIVTDRHVYRRTIIGLQENADILV